MSTPLMPKATAVWLVENTSLTFEQISKFCEIHILEVRSIANAEGAARRIGINPILSGNLTEEEIKRCEEDPTAHVKLSDAMSLATKGKKKIPKYTPVSKRADRPNAIAWVLKQYPQLIDAQIVRLLGTTRPTIESIRNKSHWSAKTLTPMDPTHLGLCTQKELMDELQKAEDKALRKPKKKSRKKKTAPKKTAAKAKKVVPKKTAAKV